MVCLAVQLNPCGLVLSLTTGNQDHSRADHEQSAEDVEDRGVLTDYDETLMYYVYYIQVVNKRKEEPKLPSSTFYHHPPRMMKCGTLYEYPNFLQSSQTVFPRVT